MCALHRVFFVSYSVHSHVYHVESFGTRSGKENLENEVKPSDFKRMETAHPEHGIHTICTIFVETNIHVIFNKFFFSHGSDF